MATALTLLLMACLLQSAQCGQFEVSMPQTINVLSGSCVTIPCSFDVQDGYRSNLDKTCKAKWKNEQDVVVFDSSNPQSPKGNLTGDLTKKDCTTTLNNMKPEDSKKYYLRVECDNDLKYNFKEQKLIISVKDHLPKPTLTPSTLKVKDGNSVTLKCSAPAPCLSHPPTLTWTPDLGVTQETLRKNPDKTKVKSSVLTFTASHLHHGQEISCTAVYNKQDGSTESSVSTLTADVSYPPKHTTVSVSPSGPVPEDSTVTLTCSSIANPAVRDYTWYTAQGGQETVMGTGRVLQIQASQVRVPFFCKAENDLGAGRSTISQIDVQCAQCGQFEVSMPQTINVLSGSCVTIPCSFDVEDGYRSNLDETCKAMWRNEQDVVVFDSIGSQSPIKGNLTGDLTKKDCTTTLNNMKPEDSKKYYLRVECNNPMKYDFKEQKLEISVKDHPPAPTLTPSTLKVKDGNSVKLTCSAPAPCLSHPPTLTWTPDLGVIQETLQENQDKTKVKTSVLTFTASHLHHGQEISCTAVYNKQDGSTESSVSTLTADVSYPPKLTTVSVSPSGPVPEDNTVTLTCSSNANPAVRDYTWYTAQGGQETVMGTGRVLQIQASKVRVPSFCKAENDLGAGRSTISQIDVQYAPKLTTVSVSPSGPVPEDSTVTLTCSSNANPAVRDYTWYTAQGGQETVMGTGRVLHIQASKVRVPFFCKAENDLGAGRSTIIQIDVQYAPKLTTVSVSPSGPVPEDSTVTLTCSSNANPAVRDYTWYTAQGGQETVMGTGRVLHIQASKVRVPFFCKAENDLGAGRSTIIQIDVQFAPQILSSSDCTKSADQLNCSCETVGNPSPTLQWYLDGLPVNHSDKFAISSESLNDTGLRIIITVKQPQWRDLSTLLCHGSSSLGSVTQRFYVYSLEAQTSAESHDLVMLTVLIAAVVALLVLVCALLLVIRRLKSTEAMSQLETATTGDGNEVPNTEAEESIFAIASAPDSANLPNSGPNNEEGATKSSEKKSEESANVIYSSVNWKSKSKKKRESTVDKDQPGCSYLEEERCMVGATHGNILSNALEMESLYDNVGPRNVNKEVECEYAQVKFKNKRDHE